MVEIKGDYPSVDGLPRRLLRRGRQAGVVLGVLAMAGVVAPVQSATGFMPTRMTASAFGSGGPLSGPVMMGPPCGGVGGTGSVLTSLRPPWPVYIEIAATLVLILFGVGYVVIAVIRWLLSLIRKG